MGSVVTGPGASGSSSWNNPTRTLTSLGSGVISFPAITFTTLPALSQVDIRPAPGTANLTTVVAIGTATGTTYIWLTDGTNVAAAASIANGGSEYVTAAINNTCWIRVRNNDSTFAGSYIASSMNLRA